MKPLPAILFVLILGLVGCASSSDTITLATLRRAAALLASTYEISNFLMLSMTSTSMSKTEASESIFCLPWTRDVLN